MPQVVTVQQLGEVIVAGNDYIIDLTLQKDGVIEPTFLAGATLTASMGPGGDDNSNILTDLPCVVTDADLGLATLTLTKANTLLLAPGKGKRASTILTHYGDIKVIESGGNETHCGPFAFPVRGAIT